MRHSIKVPKIIITTPRVDSTFSSPILLVSKPPENAETFHRSCKVLPFLARHQDYVSAAASDARAMSDLLRGNSPGCFVPETTKKHGKDVGL